MSAQAERSRMANGNTNGSTRTELARTIQNAKRAQYASRDLLRALRALESSSFEFDFFGRVIWNAAEKPEAIADAVRDLLLLAREDYPNQEIEVNVRVRVPVPAEQE